MRKVKVFIAAVALAIPLSVTAAPPAHACYGEICDGINAICNLYKNWDCVK